MIEVTLLRATNRLYLGKNALFKEGELYFARTSKNGDDFVIRSEEGYWIPVYSFRESGYLPCFKPDGFSRKATVYMRNRKRLNEFDSVEEYLDGGNAKKWWYSFYYRDVKLFD